LDDHYIGDAGAAAISPDFQNAINQTYDFIHQEEDGNVKEAGVSTSEVSDLG